MTKKPIKHITILIYAHPELYPPTLSAIEELSQITDTIDVVTRNMLTSKWAYPNNVKVNYINKKKYAGFEIETISFVFKIIHFLMFILMSYNLIKNKKSQIVLAYDVIPLFVTHLLKKTLKKQACKIWYHNHDITDLSGASKFSLMSIASKSQKAALQSISLFSLPSIERVKYFNQLSDNVTPILIPNYPHKKFYSSFTKTDRVNSNKLKLVYQGSIGPGHGLEDIIKVLNKKVNKKTLELHLVGKIRPTYLKELQQIALSNKVSKHLFYHGMYPFSNLPKFLESFDVGVAIHTPYNITYATGGSASNKIYEYAAIGLPVLLFNNKHYKSYLQNTDWAFFTDLTTTSLLNVLEYMDMNWQKASISANKDFNNIYNYEHTFLKFRQHILGIKK